MNDMADFEAQLRDKTLTFPGGLPGFPHEKRFVLRQTPQERPFGWLNSLDTPDLAFAVIEPKHLVPDFAFEVDDEDLKLIGSPDVRDLGLLIILRIEQSDRIRIYANLRAPVVINNREKKARQVILGDDCGYSDSALFTF